jgi:hypothetical protein
VLTHGSEEVQGAKRPPFHVRYVNPGAIVVPGLSGLFPSIAVHSDSF